MNWLLEAEYRKVNERLLALMAFAGLDILISICLYYFVN